MIKYIGVVLVFLSFTCHGQPLRDINYEYLYNPVANVAFHLKPVRTGSTFTIVYAMQAKDTTNFANEYSIQWEVRNLLSDKEGTPVTLSDHVSSRTPLGISGRGTISAGEAVKIIVAKVIRSSANRAWLFYTFLEPNYPVNNYLIRDGSAVTESFIGTDDNIRMAEGAGEWIVSYYDDNFPAAAPAFSEAQAKVPRVMAVDSVYAVNGTETINFSKKGLYLLQKDTTSVEGFAFRVEEDYPQYTKLANLSGPLIYISTRQEYERLTAAEANKKAFDRVVLNIATDTERARILMRNYFRRVELANRFFTSYKEGWKTDRGMIYLIFGAPEEVFKFSDREVWNYKNDQFDIRFTFSKSSSLFDPDNFVLIREGKYEDTWYEVIDLWRNARF